MKPSLDRSGFPASRQALSPARRGAGLSPWAALATLLALVALLAPSGSLQAQEALNNSFSILGGIGGSFDADPDPGIDQTSFQLVYSLVRDTRTRFGVRVGSIDFGNDELLGPYAGAELTYVTAGGEYRQRSPYWDSGLYVALGGYRLEGTNVAGGDDEDTALGLALGSTAEFPINRRFSILAELSGHIVDLEETQFFGMLHVGLTFNF
ncbi:MAG: hypothetical protein AAGD01_12570 [Acidobacteriota bacterium]